MKTVFKLEDFKVGKNYVIEASAGTGKTYNIVEIVNRLVDKHNISLDKILIVTYTEKAAGELKDRIRGKLKGEDVDNASIFTIHSFCQNTIKEFGISANLPLNLGIISDEELNKYADRYLREGDILKDITSYSTSKKFNFDTMKKILVASVNKYYLNNNFEEESIIIKLEDLTTDEKTLYDILSASKTAKTIDDVLTAIPEMKKNYEVFKTSTEKKAQEFIVELERCYNQNFAFNGHKFGSRTAWSKDEATKQILSQAFTYFEHIKNLIKEPKQCIYTYLTKVYLKDFYIKWQKEKEINKYQTFNDMLRYVRESVLEENSSLMKKLRDKYTYAIIDEFQDTNQLQFDIFKNVFMCEDHNIIVVGDPKQSIYSFQGADIEVYYAAKEAIEASGGVICELVKNFRSSASMVKSCNELFKYFDFAGTDFTSCGYLLEEVDEKEHKFLYEGKPIDSFWIADSLDLDEQTFAKIAVETIVDCCMLDDSGHTKLRVKEKDLADYRDVSFKDFAVLAKARSEMNAIERALAQVGIPYIRYKDESLFKGKECADWITIFKVLNTEDLTGSNRKVFKKSLFTKFFGLSLKKISDEKYDTDLTDEIKLVKRWRLLAEARRWEDLVDDIIVESGITDRMKTLSEIQSLGIYKQIGNYCVLYLSNNHSIEELISRLENMTKGISGDDDDDGGSIVEKTTNFDCVQIMTMHASKGLQFPVVISVAGFRNPRKNDVFSYHLKENGMDLHMLGFEENDQTTLETIEEYKRLFYVGYTRAQFVMLLPLYSKFGEGLSFIDETMKKYFVDPDASYKSLKASEFDLDSLKGYVKEILGRSANENLVIEAKDAKEKQDIVLKNIIKQINEKSTFKHSYSSLSHSELVLEDDEDKEGETLEGLEMFDKNAIQILCEVDSSYSGNILPANYPKGTKTGTVLHEVFEQIDFTNHKENISKIILKTFEKHGVKLNDEFVEPTIEMLDHVLNAKLPVINGSFSLENESFTLSTLSNSDVKKEVEFNFNLMNEQLRNYFNGFIDLIFKKGEYYSILDWKSDRLTEEFTSYSDNNELKRHVNSAYSVQRVLYAYCLIKWLKGYYINETESEIFNNHFGGIYYIFLRGCYEGTGNGVYAQTWNSWEELEESFKEIINNTEWGRKYGK